MSRLGNLLNQLEELNQRNADLTADMVVTSEKIAEKAIAVTKTSEKIVDNAIAIKNKYNISDTDWLELVKLLK